MTYVFLKLRVEHLKGVIPHQLICQSQPRSLEVTEFSSSYGCKICCNNKKITLTFPVGMNIVQIFYILSPSFSDILPLNTKMIIVKWTINRQG